MGLPLMLRFMIIRLVRSNLYSTSPAHHDRATGGAGGGDRRAPRGP
jgi:hypothetical protein